MCQSAEVHKQINKQRKSINSKIFGGKEWKVPFFSFHSTAEAGSR